MFRKHDDLYDMICLGNMIGPLLYDLIRNDDDLYDIICLGSMMASLI